MMIDDACARVDTSDFCAAVENAYIKLTGNSVKDTDIECIKNLSLCFGKPEQVIFIMLKVSERKEGNKINSFNYFMPEIERILTMPIVKEKSPSKNDLDGRYPETSNTAEIEQILDYELNAELSRTSSGVYNYDD